MPQDDTWKQLARQSGVGGIRKLLGQYRVDLTLAGAPAAIELKLYEQQDGRYEAVSSHVLSYAPPKPKTAMPPRPAVSKPLGTKPAEAKPAERPAPESFATAQEALTQTVQTLIQMARISKHAAWEPNPGF